MRGGGGRLIFQTLRWGGRGGPPPPRAHLQISDVSDQVVPDFSIAQETILVNRNSRKLQGASFRDYYYYYYYDDDDDDDDDARISYVMLRSPCIRSGFTVRFCSFEPERTCFLF